MVDSQAYVRDNENNDSNDSGENKFLPFSPLSDRGPDFHMLELSINPTAK